ncbi:MAG: hypothetical protein AB1679_31340 [Actinomycetota bacterium]|jgi:hypothetical protein
MKGRRAALALAAVAVAAGMPARAHSVPHMLVAVSSVPIPALSDPATSVLATCGSGTPLVGGGMLIDRADPTDPTLPTVGLRGKGSYPSDATGVPAGDGTADPAAWSATANFALESQVGNRLTSFALCTTRPLRSRVVVSATVNGPTAAAAQARVTVTCPPNTLLLGGGAYGTPPESRSLKPVGMYPSDAAGNVLADGTANPTSWTAIGMTGNAGGATHATTAYAVCAEAPEVMTRIARLDGPGPVLPATSTTTTVGCGEDALLGGGVLVDNPRGALQYGVHLKGSYPSDSTGIPAVAGTADPAAWSARVSSGGQIALNTTTHVFALCAVERSVPTPI